jgi:hypothetical protein
MAGIISLAEESISGFVEDFEYGPPITQRGCPLSEEAPAWKTYGSREGVAGWEIVSEACHSGRYCARSGLTPRDDESRSFLEITLEILEAGEISFWVRVDSEEDYDGLLFYIDDQRKGAWSEEGGDWEEARVRVSAGRHTFKWVYLKDIDTSVGEDAAWIDDIRFPSFSGWPCRMAIAIQEVPLDPRPEPPSGQLGVPQTDRVAGNSFTRGIVTVEGKEVEVPREYSVQVPKEGADLLAVILRSGSGGNLDLYGRARYPVEVPPEVVRVRSDFASASPGGEEVLVISNPKAGTKYWFIVENRESFPQDFTITAFLLPEIRPAADMVTGRVEIPSNLPSALARYLQTAGGQLGLQQYRIEVPQGARELRISLEGEGDLNLYLRFGEPVEILPDGRLAADASAISHGRAETLTLSGSFLRAGTWYIAVEGLNPPQDFTLTISLERGERGT